MTRRDLLKGAPAIAAAGVLVARATAPAKVLAQPRSGGTGEGVKASFTTCLAPASIGATASRATPNAS